MVTVDFSRLGLRTIPDRSELRILDIGCGQGRHVCEAVCNKNVLAVGADRNLDDLRVTGDKLRSQEEAGEVAGQWEITAADITTLPFRDNWFDIVICSEILEHVRDHETAIREATRVLRPDGDLVVSVPRYFPERVCWFLSKAYCNTPGGHIRIYRKKEIVSLIENAGAGKRHRHFAHALHTPYWWLKCLVGLRREDSAAVSLYKRFLEWDIMEHPRITRIFEKWLNPVLGKSVVFYFKKAARPSDQTSFLVL